MKLLCILFSFVFLFFSTMALSSDLASDKPKNLDVKSGMSKAKVFAERKCVSRVNAGFFLVEPTKGNVNQNDIDNRNGWCVCENCREIIVGDGVPRWVCDYCLCHDM